MRSVPLNVCTKLNISQNVVEHSWSEIHLLCSVCVPGCGLKQWMMYLKGSGAFWTHNPTTPRFSTGHSVQHRFRSIERSITFICAERLLRCGPVCTDLNVSLKSYCTFLNTLWGTFAPVARCGFKQWITYLKYSGHADRDPNPQPKPSTFLNWSFSTAPFSFSWTCQNVKKYWTQPNFEWSRKWVC